MPTEKLGVELNKTDGKNAQVRLPKCQLKDIGVLTELECHSTFGHTLRTIVLEGYKYTFLEGSRYWNSRNFKVRAMEPTEKRIIAAYT